MFENRIIIRVAGYMGMLAALGYVAMSRSAGPSHLLNALDATAWDASMNVIATPPDGLFAAGVVLGADLCAVFFLLALASRAARLQPVSAVSGAALLISSVAISGAWCAWQIFGNGAAAHAQSKAGLQQASQMNVSPDMVFVATAVSLAIPGFACMAYAVRKLKRVERLMTPAFALAAFAQLLSVLVAGYALTAGSPRNELRQFLAAASSLGAWVAPAIAWMSGAFWLARQAAAMPVHFRRTDQTQRRRGRRE